MDIASFVEKWRDSASSERANKDPFLIELCDVLGVPRPAPTTGDTAKDLFVFEKPIVVTLEGGKTTTEPVRDVAGSARASWQARIGTKRWSAPLHRCRCVQHLRPSGTVAANSIIYRGNAHPSPLKSASPVHCGPIINRLPY